MKLELRSVIKTYSRTRALDHVSLEIEPGQIIALLGPNGAGKTTLLRCLAGLVAPDKGMLLYDDEVFERSRLDQRKRLLFLPDFPVAFLHWSAIQHAGMLARLYEIPPLGLADRLANLLKDFDLLHLSNQPLGSLSRGQYYKAHLAAMIAVNPEIWLLDEPFASGMDPLGLNAFKEHCRQAATQGRTIIYSTQILEVAEKVSDKVCVIHQGEVRAFDSVQNLQTNHWGEGSALEELFRQLRMEGSA